MKHDSRSSRRCWSLPPLERDGSRPLIWVRSQTNLEDAVATLLGETVIGLDVETTLGTCTLCLIQIAGRDKTYLIDALDVTNLAPLADILGRPGTDEE